MNREKIKYFLNSLLLLTFFSSLTTGLLKFPGLLNWFGVKDISLPFYLIDTIHDWSGLILIVLILIHLFLNRRWLVLLFNYKIGPFKLWHLLLFLIVLSIIGFSVYIQNYSPLQQKAKELASKEVRDYQGENLSSINDLQDLSIAGTQNIDINNYFLEISGLVNNPQKYSYSQVLSFENYKKVVELHCVEGWSAKILWEGVLLKDLLNSAGIKSEAKVAIFYAQDGFTTSLPLDYIFNNDIILAYKANGVVLPPEKGFPFQLVAEDKWGYKWIKWLTKIELSDDVNYKGTWEKGGYNNDADINGPKTGD